MLRLAASLDQGSEHPLAITAGGAVRERGMDLDKLDKFENFETESSFGVRGQVAGRQLALSNATSML